MFEQKGFDIARFTSTLIDVLKEFIVYKKTKKLELLKLLDQDKINELNKYFSSEDEFSYIEILLEAQSNYKKVNTPKSYFELASLKMCHVEHMEDIVAKEVVREIVKEVVRVEEVEENKNEKQEPKTEEEPVKEEIKEEAKPAANFIPEVKQEDVIVVTKPEIIEQPKVEKVQEKPVEITTTKQKLKLSASIRTTFAKKITCNTFFIISSNNNSI